jgi:hypothetical protein
MRPPCLRTGSARRRVKLALAALTVLIAFGAGGASARAASFTITKQTDPAGDRTAFTFHVTFRPQPNDIPPAGFSPPADFQLTGGQSRTFTVHKGFYTVTERAVSGWRLVDIRCDNGNDPDPGDAPTINLGSASATIELSKPESKACTFRNARTGTPPPPGPPPPGSPPPGSPPPVTPPPTAPAPPSGSTQAAGTNVARSSARIVAPHSCVSRRFTVVVRGGRVQSVTFFVNGRRVRTLTARARRFSVTLPRPVVVTHVVARVRFTASVTPRTRTVRATIRRCSQRAVRPKFTG